MLVHPGGPFWANKDRGAWSIPKGEFETGEEPLSVAKREFEEEIGQPAPEGELVELGSAKSKSGKINYIWALAGSLDVTMLKSNTFMMEWPPRSGEQQEFVEVDRAGWFVPEKAVLKLNPGQVIFIERLADHLGFRLTKIEQPSLF